MKIVKILILLILVSLQAGATGYSHNMFVAHKKLQAGKECPVAKEQIITRKSDSSNKAKATHQSQPVVSLTKQFANKITGMVTLNQRIIEEGPSSLFQLTDKEAGDDSVVTKLVGVVKVMVYSFVTSSTFGKS